jgi:hypothetical protein
MAPQRWRSWSGASAAHSAIAVRDFAPARIPQAAKARTVIGEVGTQYYLEPPLHASCALYALRACPVLHRAMAGIEIALADTYTLVEDRITGVTPDGQPHHAKFPFAESMARELGTLAFYVATPDDPHRSRGTAWLTENRATMAA